jgi:DNA end-binding protein Ku
VQLVEQIASDSFTPENYSDGVRDQILEAIEQKVAGQELTFAPKDEPKAQVIDLMDALKASLGDPAETLTPKKAPAKKRTAAKKAPAKKTVPKKAASTTKRKPAKKAPKRAASTPAKKRANAKK